VKPMERGYSRSIERSARSELVLGRETSEAGKDDERIEASTAQVSSFETDGLHPAFCAAEYVAKTMEESDFESELHRETEAFVSRGHPAYRNGEILDGYQWEIVSGGGGARSRGVG